MTQDAHRHQQFEMFLGAKRETHFPSLRRTTKATPATNASEDEEARRVSLARPRSVGASAFAALSRSVGSGSFNGGFASASFETHREGAAVHAGGGANAAFSSSPLHQTRRGSVDLAPCGTSPTERAGGGGGGGGGAGLARDGDRFRAPPRGSRLRLPPPPGARLRVCPARATRGCGRMLRRTACSLALPARRFSSRRLRLARRWRPPRRYSAPRRTAVRLVPSGRVPAAFARRLWSSGARARARRRASCSRPRRRGEHAAPTAFDALAGASLDALAPLAVDVAIPRVAPGTAMAFPMIGVDGDRLQSEVSSESLGGGGGGGGVGGYAPWSSRWRFDDAKTRAETLAEDAATLAGGALAAAEEEEAARDEFGPGPGGDFFAPGRSKARVVCLVFRSDRLPPDACMALGHVEVLGRPSGERGGAGGEPYPFRGDGGGISGGEPRREPGGGDARRRPGGAARRWRARKPSPPPNSPPPTRRARNPTTAEKTEASDLGLRARTTLSARRRRARVRTRTRRRSRRTSRRRRRRRPRRTRSGSRRRRSGTRSGSRPRSGPPASGSGPPPVRYLSRRSYRSSATAWRWASRRRRATRRFVARRSTPTRSTRPRVCFAASPRATRRSSRRRARLGGGARRARTRRGGGSRPAARWAASPRFRRGSTSRRASRARWGASRAAERAFRDAGGPRRTSRARSRTPRARSESESVAAR